MSAPAATLPALPISPVTPLKVRFRARDRKARIELLALLDQSGRLALHPADPADMLGCAGLFAVPKSLERDRLIIDARPGNMTQATDADWLATMATANNLLSLELLPEEDLWITGADVRDYYHNFLISQDRSYLYRFVGTYAPRELSHFRCFQPELLQCAAISASLNTMAMGDANSVSFGQAAHVGLMLAARVVPASALLCLRGRIPRSPIALGIVIDDLVLLERSFRALGPIHSAGIAAAAHKAYQDAHLPVHPDKCFQEAHSASFWGCDADGREGWVRPCWSRLVPLVGLTIACLRLPCFSVSLLQVLAGSWVSVLAFRRRCLSILDHIYVLQRGRDRKDLVGTTPELRSELFCLCVLAPQLVADMRAQSSNYLVATDASDDRGAAVGTSLPGCWGRELQRHTLVKGLWNRLLKPSEEMLLCAGQLHHDDELPGESYRTHALWTLLARGLRFHSIADFAREPRVHINVKELQSYLITEEFLSTSVWEGARFVSMLDSQVVLGSLVKGRSSSPSLNRALQGSVPAYLFFGLHPAYAFVASGDNPSDDGTRGRPLRGPTVELPAWFDAGATGDFEPFDLFLGRLGLLPEQLQGLPELFERFTSRSGLPLPPAGARRVFSRCHSEDRFEETLRSRPEVPSANPAGARRVFSRCHSEDRFEESLRSRPEVPSANPAGARRVFSKCHSEDRFEETFRSRPEVPSAKPGAPASNPVSHPTAQPLPLAARAFFASCAAGQFVWPGAGRPKASVRPDVPVYLCLFSGARGVAKAVVRTLQVPALTFDWADSPSQDLSQLELQQALLEATRCGAFLGVGFSPPWATFSAASMPRVRSRSHPCGLECLGASDAQKVAKDNALASFVADFSLSSSGISVSLSGLMGLTPPLPGSTLESSRLQRASQETPFGLLTAAVLTSHGKSARGC